MNYNEKEKKIIESLTFLIFGTIIRVVFGDIAFVL